jgi:hypothetical protein
MKSHIPIYYKPNGESIPIYYTPSGLSGSIEEFERRCQVNPGLLELERIARTYLNKNQIYSGEFPSPLPYTTLDAFKKAYVEYHHQITQYYMLVAIPDAFISGIDIPPTNYHVNKKSTIFSIFFKKWYHKFHNGQESQHLLGL